MAAANNNNANLRRAMAESAAAAQAQAAANENAELQRVMAESAAAAQAAAAAAENANVQRVLAESAAGAAGANAGGVAQAREEYGFPGGAAEAVDQLQKIRRITVVNPPRPGQPPEPFPTAAEANARAAAELERMLADTDPRRPGLQQMMIMAYVKSVKDALVAYAMQAQAQLNMGGGNIEAIRDDLDEALDQGQEDAFRAVADVLGMREQVNAAFQGRRNNRAAAAARAALPVVQADINFAQMLPNAPAPAAPAAAPAAPAAAANTLNSLLRDFVGGPRGLPEAQVRQLFARNPATARQQLQAIRARARGGRRRLTKRRKTTKKTRKNRKH